ncbi:MAG: [FeFe] hydrogenase H-cluster radical SAM maturase HydE [Abditibacteriota bacterium]|nr:[FeFe] hydrogenase H-cluster radical SAM maturase HydE [Abditibacteriota bacterium]
MLDDTFAAVTDTLRDTHSISREGLRLLLESEDAEHAEYLFRTARATAEQTFGKEIYLRGLVEFTNYCKNDCFYCGIRRSNSKAERYRLTEEEILACCDMGAELGFGTFVLQGGEDPYFTDDRICGIVEKIKQAHPSCAVTLSIGEKPRDSYRRYFDAGADRYLLRHETANEEHYGRLHPAVMSLANRKRCLFDLKDIGFQTGCGFMVGSPFQTIDAIYDDIEFMRELRPHMIGIGPFIAHKDTPFAGEPDGSVSRTLRLLSVLRLLFPKALLPATTALGTADPRGREKGILAGANVLMPNLSPVKVRKKYMIYDGKICTGEEAAECNACLKRRVESIGYRIAGGRGDHPDRKKDPGR